MDGEGRNADAFVGHDDGEHKTMRAFDPSAVLRAIEDEDHEVSPAPRRSRPEADLGAALRAAMAYDVADDTMGDEDASEAWADEPGEDPHEADMWEASDDHDVEDEYLAADDPGDAEADAAEEDPSDDAMVDEDAPEVRADEAGAHPHQAERWEASDDHDAEDEYLAADDPGDAEADAAEEDPSDDAVVDEDASGALAVLAQAPDFPPMDALDMPGRKPRVALMGEFSAGKSTLSNLLIGASPLPMKVTATQLPPVWISWGDGPAYREDLYGDTYPIDIARLSDIDPAETRMIRIFARSEILRMCDIIDMPGISDPNMESEVWERVIGKADAVIWCTHATQAWRQSEASVWESLDPALHDKSLLLVTRFDKLHGESDRARVLRRVERETEGLFSARLPISLTEALSAGDDADLMEKSGAAAFQRELIALLDRLGQGLGHDRAARTSETLARDGLVAPFGDARTARGITPSRILPRRIRPVSEAGSFRSFQDSRDPGH